MGKSAKVHKRTLLQKIKTSNAGTGTGASTALTTPTPTPTPTAPKPAAVTARPQAVGLAAASVASSSAAKKAKLKGNIIKKRAKLRASGSTRTGSGAAGARGHVLGGADYVDIMMGSRRREREEAMKLPRDTDVV